MNVLPKYSAREATTTINGNGIECVHLFQLICSRSADCHHSWSCHSETTWVYNNLQHVAAATTRTRTQTRTHTHTFTHGGNEAAYNESDKSSPFGLCVCLCVWVSAMWQVFGCGCDCCCHMSPLIKHKITLGFLAASCRCSCSVARQLPRGQSRHKLPAECEVCPCECVCGCIVLKKYQARVAASPGLERIDHPEHTLPTHPTIDISGSASCGYN